MKWPEKEKLCLSSRNRSDDQDRTGLGNDSVPDSISTLNNAYGSNTSTNMRKKKFEKSHMAVLMCMNNLTEHQHWLSSVSQTEWKCAFQNYHHEVLITNMVALGGESLRGDWMWMRSREQNTHFGICSFRRRDTKIIRFHVRTQRESDCLHVKRRPEQEDLNLEDS